MYNIAIGYDNENKKLAYTAAESILETSTVPINFLYVNKNNIKEYTRPRGGYDSTEFSNSRFMVPYLYDYKGWTLFLDNDIIVKHDIKELFDYADDKYTIMCCQHNQVIENDHKFLGYRQTDYSYKNWSSVILFNNRRCKSLTPKFVNEQPGLVLHQFEWLKKENSIGQLPLEWNHLVDNKNQSINPPKLIHYTNGGPYFNETKDCSYANDWNIIYRDLLL